MTARTSLTREQIVAAYDERSTLATAAEKLGCAVDTLRRAMRELGISTKPPGRPKAKNGFAIYVLIDPREQNVIRYIGWSGALADRFASHVRDGQEQLSSPIKSHKRAWLAKLLREGIKPLMQILAIVESKAEAGRIERAYIAVHRRRADCRLTNDTEGGEGAGEGYGVCLTPEALERRVESQRAFYRTAEGKAEIIRKREIGREAKKRQVYTDEARSKMSAAKFGKPHARQRTAEWNAKIRASNEGKKHRPMTDEQKARHAAALKSEEARAKMSASAKARHERERRDKGETR